LERREKPERKASEETFPMKLPICSAPFNILLNLDGHQNKILKDQTKLTQHILEGLEFSAHHMFGDANQRKWKNDDAYSGLPQRVFSGLIPQTTSYNLTSDSQSPIAQKIFEAQEFAMCPSARLEVDDLDHIALIYHIGNSCRRPFGLRNAD